MFINVLVVVEKKIFNEKKKTRHDIGKENFIKEIFIWKDEYEILSSVCIYIQIEIYRWFDFKKKESNYPRTDVEIKYSSWVELWIFYNGQSKKYTMLNLITDYLNDLFSRILANRWMKHLLNYTKMILFIELLGQLVGVARLNQLYLMQKYEIY